MQFIERKAVLDQLQCARSRSSIVVISGLYGAGKSTLLAQIAHLLREERPPIRILTIDGENRDEQGRTGAELVRDAKALGVGPSALFIDNAEMIEDLAPALQAILARHTVTIILAGRNSRTLETLIDRHFSTEGSISRETITVYPLSYPEFIQATGRKESRETLDLYCRTGGLPQSLLVDPTSPDSRELHRIRSNSFLLTELIEVHAIRNPVYIRHILSLVARNTGERLSARMVCAVFSRMRLTISPQSALDYLAFCQDSGILIATPLFDITKNRIVENCESWYFADAGLRSSFCPLDNSRDLSRAEENLALLRLISDGWKVMRGRLGSGSASKEEITFVCSRGDQKAYVEILGSRTSGADRLKKTKVLLCVPDAWPRYLVDPAGNEESADGIYRLSIRELLLEGLKGS